MLQRSLFFAALLLFCVFQSSAQNTYSLPYNPDANADSAIGAPDLLEFLPLFGNTFTPAEVMVDGQTLTEYIAILEEAAANSSATDTVTIPMMPGTTPGEMLYWDGDQWSLVPTGEPGDALLLEGSTPTWRAQRLGCTDQTACNYESESTVLDPSACIYQDACGICDGPGAVYDCGCADIPEGDCDCDGNQLDALNVCGGICLEDADGDGICDDDGNDDCIGVVDACGICNGPGAIYDCGCTGIAPDACDCAGTPDVDQDGICDSIDPCIGSDDSDGDGICDDVDDCDGTYDACGVCNGPGPIYDCGCSDIPEGDCDCAGNQPDIDGNCQDYAADTDGDGLYDTLLEPCLNQSSFSHYGHDYELVSIGDRCWFRENLRATQYANGDAIPQLQDEAEWNATGQGAYSVYDADSALASVYGLLYNWTVTVDPRGACPTGWGVATEWEWNNLISTVGGYPVAGGALKEAGTTHWSSPNAGATNSSGFTALPAGERSFGGAGFTGLGTDAYFWTSSSSGSAARSVRLYHNDDALAISSISSQRGQSIRCIRNPASFGCTDINYLEYDPEANVDDGGCATPSIPGCTINGFTEYNPQANVNDGSCQTLEGCTDTTTVSYGGYDYPVVAIGTQCWFQENIRTTAYRNGDAIPNILDPVEWDNTFSAARCAYENEESNADEFGYLYNRYAVVDSRQICPVGWRPADDDDWKELESNLGMPLLELDLTGFRGGAQNIGTSLKSDVAWNGTNSSGFSGLPAGRRTASGNYQDALTEGFWWSVNTGRYAYSNQAGLGRLFFNDREAMSVRCLRSVLGCTDQLACNYNPEANEDDGSCDYLSCAICNLEYACNYQMQPEGTYVNNAVCEFPDYGYDCNGDCLPEFLVDGDCIEDAIDCGDSPISVFPVLGATQYEVFTFQASGTLIGVDVVSTWAGFGGSWPGDMAIALVSPTGQSFGVQGFGSDLSSIGYSVADQQSWPSFWNSTSPGTYAASFVPQTSTSGSGTWQLVIFNAWGGSSTVFYDLQLTLTGLCITNYPE